MSFNLLNTVKDLFNQNLVSGIASTLGESEGGIHKALSGAIPAVLTGMLQKAGTHNGGSEMLAMAKQAAASGILSNLGSLPAGGDSVGGGGLRGVLSMAGGLFGDRLPGITNLVSGFSGIKKSSAASVLNITAPAALAALGNHARQSNLSASGVTALLHSQKDAIASAVPPELDLARALGIGGPGEAVKKATGVGTHYAGSVTEKASGTRFLMLLLLGIVAVGIAMFLFKGCGGMKSETVTTDTTAHAADTAAIALAPGGPVSIKVKLPNGVELDANKGGIEDQLVTFLKTDYTKLGEDSFKKTWFNFDNLNFKTGSAEITPESQKQIDNIAAILKAFPKAKIKIGGYTDKTGDEATNKKLSDERAKAVQAALAKAGMGEQVRGAEGYGSEYAKFPADAPESDRVTDRHVSVSVR